MPIVIWVGKFAIGFDASIALGPIAALHYNGVDLPIGATWYLIGI